MELLERDSELQILRAALSEVQGGRGRVALVSGEAGIGKTTLVAAFAQRVPHGVPILQGMCDALFTPRPLGPLHDIALQLPGPLQQQLSDQAERLTIFSTFLQALRGSRSPLILLIEDIHWADEATLDLIKFLGRRIEQTRCLLVLTYRNDELGTEHPLWFVLGELPSQTVRRLPLARLSEPTTAELASKSGYDGHALYTATGGNPFFVSEVLANRDMTIPRSVQAAVLARAARLTPRERELLEAASIFPTRAERSLLEALLELAPESYERCALTGLVRLEPEAMVFRHELGRRAILDAMAPPRSRRWHGMLLEVLLEQEEPPLARVVHHALAAGRTDIVLTHAPRAAAQAASLGAHLEAAAHYEVALQHAASIPDDERIALLEQRSYEYYLTGQIEAAVADREETLRLRRARGETEKEGIALRWLSRLSWFQGNRVAAERYAREAIETLEQLPRGEALAMAYSNRAQLHMLADESREAVSLGNLAIELAESLGASEILSHALNNVGTALMIEGDSRGRELLARSLQLALASGFEEHAARAYTNLGSEAVKGHDYSRASTYLDQGIAYTEDRDLDSWTLYMRGWRARAHLEQGRWPEAEQDASAVLGASHRATVLRLPALAVQGTLYARRGDARARDVLDEALRMASETGELQRLSPVVAARAELAWWEGEPERSLAEARDIYMLARERASAWSMGEVGVWLWRAGALPDVGEGMADPYRLQAQGDWRGAAALWETLGCPYYQALALSDGDANARRAALAIFARLGAAPAAETLRQTMRAEGIRGVPRGARSESRDNPANLTSRQWEVLGLLVEGLSDREIASRLSLSSKTAGHHVSAILNRLEVPARHDAAMLAVQRGWFEPPRHGARDAMK